MCVTYHHLNRTTLTITTHWQLREGRVLRSRTINNNNNPEYDETFRMLVDDTNTQVCVLLAWRIGQLVFLGTVCLGVSGVAGIQVYLLTAVGCLPLLPTTPILTHASGWAGTCVTVPCCCQQCCFCRRKSHLHLLSCVHMFRAMLCHAMPCHANACHVMALQVLQLIVMDEDLIGGGKVMGVAQMPLKQVSRMGVVVIGRAGGCVVH